MTIRWLFVLRSDVLLTTALQVADALVRYLNEGSTQGAVNLPEVTLRSLTLDEPNHVRVQCALYSPTLSSRS